MPPPYTALWGQQKHFRMTVTSQTNPWADAYNVSAAGEYRQVSSGLLDGKMAEGEEDGDKLIPRQKDKLQL